MARKYSLDFIGYDVRMCLMGFKHSTTRNYFMGFMLKAARIFSLDFMARMTRTHTLGYNPVLAIISRYLQDHHL